MRICPDAWNCRAYAVLMRFSTRLDAVFDFERGALLQGFDLLGLRLCHLATQPPLAPERQRLDHPVTGIADLAGQ